MCVKCDLGHPEACDNGDFPEFRITYNPARDPMFMDDDGRGWVPAARFNELVDVLCWCLRDRGERDKIFAHVTLALGFGAEEAREVSRTGRWPESWGESVAPQQTQLAQKETDA